MLKKIIELLINKIKGSDFVFDNELTSYDLIYTSNKFFFRLIRGLFFHRKIVFRGHSCNIYKATVGSGVSIGDFVTLNGIGKNNLFLGNNVSIGSYSILKVSGSLTNIGSMIKIGSNVGIGEFAHIGGAGGVIIGNNTIIGPYFSVHPENHNFSDKNILIKNQGVSHKGIKIGDNCWFGAKVTILDGVVIGNGCVIAAGAVVKDSFPNDVIIGGVPAKILKKRLN